MFGIHLLEYPIFWGSAEQLRELLNSGAGRQLKMRLFLFFITGRILSIIQRFDNMLFYF